MSIIINPKNNFKYSRKNDSERDLKILSEALGKFGDEVQTGLLAGVATAGVIFGGSALINEYRVNQNQPTQAEIGKKIEMGSQDIVNANPPESQRLDVAPKYDKYNRSLKFDIQASEGETIKPETRQAIINRLRADFPRNPSLVTFNVNSENEETGLQVEVPFGEFKVNKGEVVDAHKYVESGVAELDQSNAYIPSRDKKVRTTTTEYDDIKVEKKKKAIKDKNIKNGKYVGKF
jgi:hypothetical protein